MVISPFEYGEKRLHKASNFPIRLIYTFDSDLDLRGPVLRAFKGHYPFVHDDLVSHGRDPVVVFITTPIKRGMVDGKVAGFKTQASM